MKTALGACSLIGRAASSRQASDPASPPGYATIEMNIIEGDKER
jgi:hypothetical protein